MNFELSALFARELAAKKTETFLAPARTHVHSRSRSNVLHVLVQLETLQHDVDCKVNLTLIFCLSSLGDMFDGRRLLYLSLFRFGTRLLRTMREIWRICFVT